VPDAKEPFVTPSSFTDRLTLKLSDHIRPEAWLDSEMPASPERYMMNSMLALVAVPVSTFLGWFSHDRLGYSWSDIHQAAVIGAAVLTAGYASAVWRTRTK
jgi:hypothetical protein